MTFEQQREQNSKILTNICEHGLTNRQAVSIGTSQNDCAEYISFNLFSIPQNQGHRKKIFESLVYNIGVGLWPIALEGSRKYQQHCTDTQKLKLMLNEALANTLVFIFDPEEYQAEPVKLIKKAWHEMVIAGSEQEESYYSEIRIQRKTGYKNILGIIVPQHLYSMASKYFPQTLIVPVNDIEKDFISAPLMLIELYNIIDEQHPLKLFGPDYMSGLEKLMGQLPQNKEYGIHITRLTTSEHCHQTSLSFKGGAFNYESYNYLKTQGLLSKFRLLQLSLEKLSYLESNARFALLKDYEKPNAILTICHPRDKKLLESLVQHDSLTTLKNAAAIKIQKNYRGHKQRKAWQFFKREKKKSSSTETAASPAGNPRNQKSSVARGLYRGPC